MSRAAGWMAVVTFSAALAGCGGGGGGSEPAAVDPARSMVTASPDTAVADGAEGVTVTAVVRDAAGSALAGRQATFSVTGAGATLSALSATSDTVGAATVTLRSTASGEKQVTVRVDGVVISQRAAATFLAGPLASLGFTSQPTSGAAGEAMTVTVLARDAHGNEVGGALVGLSLQGGAAGATLSGPSAALTLADGTATFGGLAVTRAGTGYSLLATAGVVSQASAPFFVTAGPPSLATSRLWLAPATVVAGGPPATVSVSVLDAHENPVAGAVVTLASSVPGDAVGAPGPTAVDGSTSGPVGGTTAGDRTVTASVGGLPLVETATLTVTPAAPDGASSSFTGPGTEVLADGVAAATLSLVLRDAWGNPVPGAAASLSTTGGTLGASAGTTGTAGELSVTLTSTVAGPVTATADFGGGRLDAPVTFVAGPAASLELAGLPASHTAGVAASVTVTARDALGNRATGYRGTVHLTSTDAAAILPAAATFTAGDQGQRTFLVALRTAGGQDVTAADTASAGLAATATTQVAPAAAASLALGGVPASPTAGSALTPEVTARDAFGNTATGYRGTVRFTSTDPAATLPADATFTAGDDGYHAFAGLVLVTAGSQVVSVTDLAEAALTASSSLLVAPGAPSPTGSALAASPASVPSDGTSVALTATVRDAFGNPVGGAGVHFAASGSASLVQPAGPSAADGTASGSVSSLAPGLQVVSASVDGVVIAQAGVAFSALPVSATLSTVVVRSGSVPADGRSTATVTVTARDVADRPLAGRLVGLAFSGPGTLHPATRVTDGFGAATFSAWSGGAGAGTFTATVDPGAGQVVVAQQPALAFTAPADLYVAGVVFGLTGDGLVLSQAGQADLPVAAGAPSFHFATPVPAGAGYSVTISAQPAGQACEVLEGSGVAGAGVAGLGAIISVVVTCGGKWAQVAGGAGFSLALRANGDLYAWGYNYAGQLGDGSNTDRPAPVLVGSGFTAIAAGQYHSLALKAGGDLYAWGHNSLGQLGDGSTTWRNAPLLVGSGFTAIAAGATHSLGLKANGELYAWGRNDSGQVGDGSTTTRTSPVLVGGGFTAVAAGTSHSLGVKANGDLLAWGYNRYGQLGDGSNIDRPSPVLVGTGYATAAGGQWHSLGVKANGDLLGWGDNVEGQVGDGTTVGRYLPVQVGTGYLAVSAGSGHSVGLKASGELLAWGQNSSGQLGDGSGLQRTAPVLVGAGFTAVSAGRSHVLGVLASGALRAWGTAYSGELGDNRATVRPAPALVGAGFVAIAAGGVHALGLRANGDLYAWGENDEGQLGDGSRVARNEPVAIGTGFVAVAAGATHSLGLKAGGDLYAWGGNGSGQLGDGSNSPRTAPVLVGSGFAAVAAGQDHSLAVTAGGDLYAWGGNASGQLGDGSTTLRTAPVLVGSGFVTVAAGNRHSLGLKAGGDLFAWGYNGLGQLGDGTTTLRLAPTFVGGGYAAISAGSTFSLGVRSDGSLFGWGNNSVGQLGDGTAVDRPSPTLVGDGFAAAWAGANYALGLKVGGELQGWGYNANGQVGDGTTTHRNAPVPLGAGFAGAAAGAYQAFGILADAQSSRFGWGVDARLGNGRGRAQLRPIPVLWQPRLDYLTYAPTVVKGTAGLAVTPRTPTWSGPYRTFMLTPPLPSGLALDLFTLVIQGTPSAPSPLSSHVLQITGPAGRTTALVGVLVE